MHTTSKHTAISLQVGVGLGSSRLQVVKSLGREGKANKTSGTQPPAVDSAIADPSRAPSARRQVPAPTADNSLHDHTKEPKKKRDRGGVRWSNASALSVKGLRRSCRALLSAMFLSDPCKLGVRT